MNKIGIVCFLVALAMAVALDDDDHVDHYHHGAPPKKVVYVEKDYSRPSYEIVKKVPEYKKTVYEYREPEEKRVLVKVVKQDDRKYVERPSYEPRKDVVVKILDQKY